MLAVGIVILTAGYALTYIGWERAVAGSKASVTYLFLGKSVQAPPASTPSTSTEIGRATRTGALGGILDLTGN